jgi:plastocyanin
VLRRPDIFAPRDAVVLGQFVLDTDEMFSHTFAAAGTYKYYCSIHPRMTGRVVVR